MTQLKWQSLDSLIAERDVITVHKLLCGSEAPVNLRHMLTYRHQVSARSTRAAEAGLLQLPRVRSERARRSFCYRAAKTWNTVPAVVREPGTVNTCRSRLRSRT